MTTKNDGGPAFPAPADVKTDLTLRDVSSGMSLRDWFAGQALVAIADDCGMTDEEIAERCYARADAMLSARGEPS